MDMDAATVPGDAGGAPQSAPETPAPTMRETLAAAFDAAQAAEGERPGVGHNGGPQMEAEAPQEGQQQAPQQGQPRAPDGKFAPKPGDPNAPPAQTAQAGDKPAPPPWLTGNAAVDWNRLPRTVQEALTAAHQQATQPATPAPHPLAEVIRPYEAEFQQRGLPPEVGIRTLLDTWSALERDPARTLTDLAQRYGLTFAAPAQRQQPAGSHQAPQQVDPHVQALHHELQEIKGHLTQQQQAQLQQRIADTAAEIDRFAKDAQNPRPHFDAVAGDMAILIQSGRAKDLADAYDMACWANPTVRAALIDEQRKADEAKRTEEAAKRATDAKRAATVNVRSTPGASPKQPASIRDTLAATYDALTATS